MKTNLRAKFTLSCFVMLTCLCGLTSSTRVQAQILCGQTTNGAISAVAEVDQYTYSGSAGQTLSFGFVGTGNCSTDGKIAVMDLYNPAGQIIATLNHCGVRSTNLTLVTNGTFTILVHDNNYTETISSYSLSIQSFTGGGCSSIPIVCGQTISTNISSASEIDAYSYVGSAGETLTFGFVGTGNCSTDGKRLYMDLYNPAGQKITTLTHCGVRSTNMTLVDSGTFTILVHDDDYAQADSYWLSIQSFTGGGCSSTPIVCGQTISTNISRASEIDAYSYVGNAGETLTFGFVGTGNCSLDGKRLYMDVYNPAGQKITTLTHCGVRSTNMTLVDSGVFTILVHDDDYAQTDSYSLSIQSFTGGGCSSIPIVCGQTISTNIGRATEVDALGFGASSGTTVIFSFAGFTGVQFDFYDPTGIKLFTRGPATSTNITLAADGTYTMLVHDDNYANTGSYSVTPTCIGGCNYLINPTGASVGTGATNAAVSVTAGVGCNWTATTNASWLSISSGTNGSGNGTVNYAVAANDSLNARVGTMTIANWTFIVNQAAAFNVVGQNIGNPGAPGSFAYSNGLFTVTGSGEDIEGTADDFYFVHQPMVGDCQIIARVTDIQGPNAQSEAGVMLREGTDTGARHVLLSLDDANNIGFRRRSATNAFSVENSYQGTNTSWMRVMRMGNTFIGHYSTNGVNWEYVWFTTLNLPSQVEVGLAVTAHNFGQSATATFDNVSIGNLTPLSGTWPLAGPKIHFGGEPAAYPSLLELGGFKLLAAGVVGDQFAVKYSTNVTLPFASWPSLGTITNQYGVQPFLDAQALTNQQRYYRLQRVGP